MVMTTRQPCLTIPDNLNVLKHIRKLKDIVEIVRQVVLDKE
jgi:hypothetical protein